MWHKTVPTTIQGFGDYCNQMQTNQTLTLKDTRDNNSYTVAKLLDEKCWMTQNLRIAGKTIDYTDSDLDMEDIILFIPPLLVVPYHMVMHRILFVLKDGSYQIGPQYNY